MNISRCVSSVFAAACLLSSAPSSADVINAFDRGWYRDNPTSGLVESFDGNLNYLVGLGMISSTVRGEYRNFFAFDLTAYQGQTFSSANLSLYNPKYGDPLTTSSNPNQYGGFVQNGVNAYPCETFELHQVLTDTSLLLTGAAGRNGYNDLANGLLFGSYNASLSDNGTFITIALNDDGLAALNNSVGGIFVLGGNVSTLAGDTRSQTVFGFTNTGVLSDTQLVLTSAVPEPGTSLLFLGGLASLGLMRRRKKGCSK